jgi:adenine-specific DNA-methyltransferase
MKSVELKDGESADVLAENIESLKELFPEAVTEGGVNFETLRQLLGDSKVLDEGEEKYGLNWHGKKKARQIALTPSTGTLLPCPDESVSWDTTQNLFIEGDNLEVLKLLQKSYSNRIKMIYIDPPYNTGKEFVYPDKYQDNLDTYLKYTGQIDNEGMKFSSNTESSGRRHTNWLNMIYPRIKLAKQLLSRDGLFFVSIDENEQANLTLLCNEVFGEENFVACITWEKMYTTKNDSSQMSRCHEYILVYVKDVDEDSVSLLPRTKEMDDRYKNTDDDHRGPWKSIPLYAKGERKNGAYKIYSPVTGRVHVPPVDSHWRYREEDTLKLIEENRIYFGKDGDSQPNLKRFLTDVQQGIKSKTLWKHDEVGSNDSAVRSLRDLYKIQKVPFDFPKPTTLIERMIELSTEPNSGDVVLDFFAGSGTTAQAVMDKNCKDGGNRRFIMVQIPESIDPDVKEQKYAASYCDANGLQRTISSLAIDRLKKTSLVCREASADADSGFRVLKLSNSNIRPWNPDRTDLEQSLLSHEEHLIEGRTEQDILFELLLKRGVDLAVPIESREVVGKNIYSIGYGVLFACLDESIARDQVEGIAQGIIAWHAELAPSSDTHVFFRDSAFRDDVSKTNMAAILEQNGITHVRSL